MLYEGLPGAGDNLFGTHGVKGLPADDVVAEPIDDGRQGRCAFPPCLDVCGVDLVGEEDLLALQQVRDPPRLPAGCREQAAGADTYELFQPVSGWRIPHPASLASSCRMWGSRYGCGLSRPRAARPLQTIYPRHCLLPLPYRARHLPCSRRIACRRAA